MDLKYLLIKRDYHLDTEQLALNKLYTKLDEADFICNNNIYLKYITEYIKIHRTPTASFCSPKKREGMNTSYLTDNLEDTIKNSAIAVMDDDNGHVLGVLVFYYVDMSDIDHDYDHSLYVEAFCTNQQYKISGIGKLLITSLIKATERIAEIDNIFLNAATRDSEGFYEKFDFEATGRAKDRMNEFQYRVNKYQEPSEAEPSEAEPSEAEPSEYASEESESTGPDSEAEAREAEAREAEAREAEAREAEARDEPPASMPLSQFVIPRTIPLPHYKMVSKTKKAKKAKTPKPKYIKIWSRGDNLRTSKNRLEQLEKVFGSDFDFTVKGRMKGGKRTIKKRTIKKRTNKKRTNKKRTNKKRTSKKRTNKKKTRKQ
jgi:hypothetical protein